MTNTNTTDRDWSWLSRINNLAVRDAAELYARNGLYVFQLAPNTSIPLGGTNGHLDATNDVDVVRELWNAYPDRNVGINLERSGLYAVDVDPRNGGIPIEEWPNAKEIPATWTESTPGGGWHYVLDASAVDGARFRKEISRGIDVKYNGYITAAPSWRGTRQYTVTSPISPARSSYIDGLVVKAKKSTTSTVNGSNGTAPDLGDRFDWSVLRELSIEPGAQDNTLQAAAGWLREFDAPDEFAVHLLGALVDRFENQPGKREWTQEDVESKWERAKEAYEPNQRDQLKLEPYMVKFAESVAASAEAKSDELPDVFIDMADIGKISSSDYVVKGMLNRPSVALIHGDGGTGKTFVALDIAFRSWLGQRWCGLRTRKVRTLYVYAENPEAAEMRRDAWLRQNDVDVEELRGAVAVYPRSLSLLSGKVVDALVEVVESQGFGLVVIDTFRRAIVGGNENSQETAQQAMAAADRLREAGACVLIVHHDNKAGGYSGNTTIHGHIDSRIHLTRVENDRQVVKIVSEKQRDMADGGATYGRLEGHVLGIDEDGDEVRSAAFVWDPEYSESSRAPVRFVKEQKIQSGVREVIQIIQERPGCTGNAIRSRVDGGVTTVNSYITEAVELGLVRTEPAGNRSFKHYLTELGSERIE